MVRFQKPQRGQAVAAAFGMAAVCFGASAFSCMTSRSRSEAAIHHALPSELTRAQALAQSPSLRGSGVQTTEGWLNWFPVGAAALISAAFAFGRSPSKSQARNERITQVVSCNVQGGVEGVRVLGGWANATNDAFTHQNLTDIRVTKLEEGVMKVKGIVPANVQGLGEEHELARGTTENSYLLYDAKDGFETGKGPLVLIDTPEMRFREAFLKVLEPYLARIESICLTVLNEAEDNMMFKAFVDARAKVASNKLKVYCVPMAKDALVEDFEGDACLDHIEFVHIEDGMKVPRPSVNGAEEQASLIFLQTTTPKIPEGLSVFDHSVGFLYTGKFFSAHTAVDVDDPSWSSMAEDWHHFFDCYFFTETAQKSVRRIFQVPAEFAEDDLGLLEDDVRVLAPLHGPTVRSETWRLMVKYEGWLERKLHLTNREGTALLMYTSAYGNTKRMADAIKRGIISAGVQVNELDLEFCKNEDISKALTLCDGIALGSPTLGGQMPIQAKEAIGVILEQAQQGGAATSVRGGKPQHGGLVPCGVFGSYGWSGEAVDEMYLRLKDGGFQFAFDPIRCKFTPTQPVEEELEEAGVRLAQKIADDVKRKARQAMEAATKTFGAKDDKSSSMEDAFGRIVNSSSILTMKGEKEIVRLPVSWVSQASFVPPGVMLALHQEGMDSFLGLSMDEQLNILFEKYDEDNSGVLDKEETMGLLDDLFGAGNSSIESNMVNEQKEKAWNLLDADGSGEIEAEELRSAAQEGELADMIAEQRRFASLESVLSRSDNNFEFTLSMLPDSMTVKEALKADLLEGKKVAAKNGCNAISGCTAFVECQVMQHSRTGNYALLYGKVTGGEVLNAAETTQLLCATHEKQPESASPESEKQESELSLAAVGSARPKAMARTRSAFTGVSRNAQTGSHQKLAPRRALALAEPQVMSQEKTWTGLTPGKEYKLQLQCQEIAQDTRTIRSLDWNRDRFDIEFALTNGTTYNAYTIKGETHTALIDASHRKFEQLFMDAVESPTGGDVDLATLSYIVVSHTEPDHSGLIANVLEAAHAKGNKDLTVIGSKVCITFLKDLMHMNFKSKIVKSKETIDLGGGHVLEFILAPNLHWPDTIFTYDHKTQLLYTCDAFGMHYCSNEVTDVESVEELNPHYQLYYNCLMRPNARSVLSALKKVKDLEITAIATGHGPIMVNSMSEWVNRYKSWSEDATKSMGPSAVIFWNSRYGESERLAQSYAYGLSSSDCLVEMQDMNAVDAFEITEAILRNQVVVVFAPPQSPTGSTAQQALSSIISNCSPKKHKFVVCSSGGEQDEPVDSIVSRFVQIGIPEAQQAMRFVDTVEEKDLQKSEESGRKLGRVLGEKKKNDKKAQLDQKTMQALGKMSSGRYIVTAMKNKVRAAEAATWVMPVSTQPLGVAVAISKDCNITSLMQVGDTFTVNALEEGNYIKTLKHFQQDFAPGADVFAGIDVTEVPTTDGAGVVVKGGCAFVVCKVLSRMDANDHFVISGEVVQGSLVKDAPVAVNHRKSAAYY